MSAKEFFEKYSIEEISKKTKISPISLEYIKNKEFEKLTKVKFLGFLKIIENEFDVNLDDLREEFNNFYSTEKKEIKEILDDNNSKNNNFLIFIIAFVFIVGGYFYLSKNAEPKKVVEVNETNISEIKEKTKKVELNKTNELNKTELKKTKSIEKHIEKKSKKIEKVIKNEVVIIPHKKVWFRVLNLDTNKTKEFLISKEVNLTGKNFYFKFGHGLITIEYNDFNITPNTKKIVRLLLKDGNFSYLPKHNRFEK